MVTKAEKFQREYYARTSGRYVAMHEGERSAHDIALETLGGILPAMGVTSLLDVGSGAGRAIKFFQTHLPGLHLAGVEPVPELIAQAEAAGVRSGAIQVGSGTKLPFEDGEFDVVTAFGVLHHVPNPSEVITEMLRVARRAVFISDSNRFGQGRPIARYIKLALHASKLWPVFNFVRSRGRGFLISEGDGLYYSYSVFDSLALLRSGSSRLMLIELETAKVAAGIWSTPLANADTVLVGAIK